MLYAFGLVLLFSYERKTSEIGGIFVSNKCDVCGKVLKTKQSFENHMKIHERIPQIDGENDDMEKEMVAAEEVTVSEVTFTPDCQADWSDKVVHDLILKKVNEVGLKPLSMTIVRARSGAFTACETKIDPIPLSRCKGISFTFNGVWTWKFG